MAKCPGWWIAVLFAVCEICFVSSLMAQTNTEATQPRPPEAAAQQGGVLPNGQTAQPQQLAVQPPFELTQQQQNELDRLLDDWEKQSSAIKQFKCYVHPPGIRSRVYSQSEAAQDRMPRRIEIRRAR